MAETFHAAAVGDCVTPERRMIHLTNGNNDIILAVKGGKAVRFNETDARPIGRTGSGVKGITVPEGDEVVGMVVADVNNQDENILVVSENGYGKRSMLEDYRVTSRGGKGVKTINITEKTGLLIAIDKVTNDDDLMIINKSGITIRVKGETVPVASRATQGVKLIDLGKRKDSIASIAVVPKSDEEDENTEGTENGDVQSAPENATNESGVETTSTPAPENTENS